MKKPIVLVIMDGVGRGDGGPGDAVKQANTPTLDKLMATCPMTWLKAHGTAVGLPTDDDMGNSEVGHNALGCGQIYSQGAKLVQESIETGADRAAADPLGRSGTAELPAGADRRIFVRRSAVFRL